MALITITRPNAEYHINTNKVSVAYNFADEGWQVQLASGAVLNLTEDEYNQFTNENNPNEGVE